MSTETKAPPHVTGYLLLFKGAHWPESLSESEINASIERVNAWFDRLSSAGKVVGAQPLMPEGVVITGKTGNLITDSPLAEAKEAVGGYVLLSVDTMEEAVEIAKTNPMHHFGLTTEVRPTASSCPHLFRLLSRPVEAVA